MIRNTCLWLCSLLSIAAGAETAFENERARWLETAERSKPQLHYRTVKPVAVVTAVKDSSAYQGWRYEKTGEPAEFYADNFNRRTTVTLDFGEHLVGYCSFHIKELTLRQDAPVRLKFTFGEVPAELNVPLDPWRGSLNRAWMQDEVVTVTDVGSAIRIARRVAFRYLKIELMGHSSWDFAIDSISAVAQSSASGVKTVLQPACPDLVRRINDVGITTLHECMQTVYEDGPKRDRRLWVGDLYLESLANRYAFKDNLITKRCLYLFAALATKGGVVISNCFETPQPHAQEISVCLTYSLLWNSTLLEYLIDTDDRTTANDLWPVALKQVEAALAYVGDDGLFDRPRCPLWLFFDWRDGLDVATPMQGATIFALQQTYELARLLGRENEVKSYPALIRKMKTAARRHLYNSKRGVAESGPDRQVSVLGQTWLIKSGVLTKQEGAKAIRTALATKECVMPGTPYATHYLIDAMLLCGMKQEARDYLTAYWGGMVEKGADTYWEAYDPKDDFISPYRFHAVNSACHAWGCTPVYFIHRYPEVFQR